MEAYIISLIATSLIASLVGILTPKGDGGIAKHLRLLTALFLICVLISPVKEVIRRIAEFADGNWEYIWKNESMEESYREELNESLQGASKDYFLQMLLQTLEQEFALESGTVRCRVEWNEGESDLRPTHVTVVLSGTSIWKDPHAIEAYVTELLDCACAVAIE
ncbi:MAG: hypothetical protein IJW50_04910 [Clostridia bacterium]|nr:hypothetical protein [Clostridia bacterium]